MAQYNDLIFNSNKETDKMIMEMLMIQEILNNKADELTQEEKYFLGIEKKELMDCFKIEFRKNNLEEILNGIEYETNYKKINYLTYIEIKVDKSCNKELLKIKNRVDKDMFYINTEFNNEKIIIEVHFKSIFSLNKTYEFPKLNDFR